MRPPLFERHPHRHRRHLFDDLPLELQQEAQQRYWQMRQDYREQHGSVPAYVEPILIGRARAVTLAGPGERSRIGRRMLAARGGHALQRKLRDQGLTGENHPYAHMAAQVSAIRRRQRKEAREREALGLPPMPRLSQGL